MFPRENLIGARKGALPLCGVLYGDTLLPRSPQFGPRAGKVVNVSMCGLSARDPFELMYEGETDGLNALPGEQFYDPAAPSSLASSSSLNDGASLAAASVLVLCGLYIAR